MFRRHWLIWIIVGIIVILVVSVISIIGGGLGYKAGVSFFTSRTNNSWESIGPPDTQINGLKVLSVGDVYPACHAVMLITSQGKLLSSGGIQEINDELHWTNISNRISWNDFPMVDLVQGNDKSCQLWVKHDGKEYRVEQNGGWQLHHKCAQCSFLPPPDNLVLCGLNKPGFRL